MSTRFWVFFDTSTLLDYYQDVHNCLAMPAGSILRYEYRTKRISEECLAAIRSGSMGQVLIVYAQERMFARGAATPTLTPQFEEMVWVAMRIAELVHVQQNGDVYLFDLKLGEYPKHSPVQLGEIVNSLHAKGESPFSKWVALSERVEILDALREGTDRENWQNIVNTIGLPPYQFRGDSFWRLDGPYAARGKALPPQVKQSMVEGRVVRLDSEYVVDEGKRLSFHLHVYTPKTDAPSESASPQRQVLIAQKEGEALAVVFPDSVVLRPYTEADVTIKSKLFEQLETQSNRLRFSTTPPNGDWPSGANFDLRFTVQKNRWRLVGGLAMLISGVTFAAYAQIESLDSWVKVVGTVAGAVFAMVGGVLLWRKIGISVG